MPQQWTGDKGYRKYRLLEGPTMRCKKWRKQWWRPWGQIVVLDAIEIMDWLSKKRNLTDVVSEKRILMLAVVGVRTIVGVVRSSRRQSKGLAKVSILILNAWGLHAVVYTHCTSVHCFPFYVYTLRSRTFQTRFGGTLNPVHFTSFTDEIKKHHIELRNK